MPNIREAAPSQPGLEIRPTEVGIDARQSAARRVGAFYSQAADDFTSEGQRFAGDVKSVGEIAVKQIEHHEINTGSKNLAAMQADITQKWNDLPKDPDDPTIAAKFREQVLEPALTKFSEQGFLTEGGQKFAEAHVNALRQHMFEKTAADMNTLAGQAAVVNHRQTENLLSNAVYNDPSSLKFSLDTLKSSTEARVNSSPNLTADARGRLNTELYEASAEKVVKAAAISYIEKTGRVPPWTSDPAYSKYVNGVELRQFQKAADAQTKANDYHDRQTEVLKKQQADLSVHKDATDLFAKSVAADPNNPGRVMVAPDFMQKALDIARRNPDAPSAAATARTYIDWAEHQQNLKDEAPRTDQTVKADLMSRMFDPDKPTTKIDILRAEANGKLNTHDGSILRELAGQMETSPIRGPLYQTAIEGAKERVGFSVLADGHERFANAIQSFMPEYMKAMRDGTLKPNALDLRDDTSLIRQSIARFEPSAKEKMEGHMLKSLGVSNLGGLNLTGQGEKVTGIKVEDAPPFNPPRTWQYSASRDQYRDPATNKIYNRAGREVK